MPFRKEHWRSFVPIQKFSRCLCCPLGAAVLVARVADTWYKDGDPCCSSPGVSELNKKHRFLHAPQAEVNVGMVATWSRTELVA